MYRSHIRLLGGIVILLIWCIAIGIGIYLFKSRNILGVSIMRIDKNNVLFVPTETLPHFYEWKPNDQIVHVYPWLPTKVTVPVNSDGLIGQTEYQIPKPQGVYRILAIGDSNTEGPFVDINNNYPSKLEQQLNATHPCSDIYRYEVLNFGVGGYDMQYAAHRFAIKGMKYHPDMIVWFLKDDDFIDLAEESRKRIDDYMATIPDDIKSNMSKWEKFGLVDEVLRGDNVSIWEKLNNVVRKEMQESIKQKHYFEIQSKSIKTVSELFNGPIVIVTFENTHPMFMARMKSWSLQYSNVNLFNGIPWFNDSNTRFVPYDGHPNENGYAIIASAIYSNLLGDNMLCRSMQKTTSSYK